MPINIFRSMSIRTKIVTMITGTSLIFGALILAFIYLELEKTLTLEAIEWI